MRIKIKILSIILTLLMLLIPVASCTILYAEDTPALNIEPKICNAEIDNYMITNDGHVYGWGCGSSCALPIGGSTNQLYPVELTLLPTGVKDISGGKWASYALLNDGTVYTWGYNGYGGCANAKSVSAYVITPTLINGLSNIVQVVGGGKSGYALKNDGTVYAWGDNGGGQLGNGTTANSFNPLEVAYGVKQLSAGPACVLALKTDGTVLFWGQGTLIPTLVPGLTDIQSVEVSCGSYSYFALKNDGTVYAWGNNSYGQLGNGTKTNIASPTLISSLSGITKIAAGSYHALFLKNDGTLWGCGYNNSYIIISSLAGDSNAYYLTPTKVSFTGYSASPKITDIGASSMASFATVNGILYSWGYQANYELGHPVTSGEEAKVLDIGYDLQHPTGFQLVGSVLLWNNIYGTEWYEVEIDGVIQKTTNTHIILESGSHTCRVRSAGTIVKYIVSDWTDYISGDVESPTPIPTMTPTPSLTTTPTPTPTPTDIPTPTETSTPTPTSTLSQELILNPSFTDGTNNWQLWTDTDGNAVGVRDAVYYDSDPASYSITCNSPGTRTASIQFFTYGINLESGKMYNLSFKAKSSIAFTIPSIQLMSAASPWTAYSSMLTASLNADWQNYSYMITSNATDSNGRLTFYFGNSMPTNAILNIDSISLKKID